MKKIFLILISIVAFVSCSKNEPWSPEEDWKDYLEKHPYGIEFKNETDGDLFIKCESLTENLIIVKEGSISNSYYSDKSKITISYSGEGTHWTTKYKSIELEKNRVKTVSITYP